MPISSSQMYHDLYHKIPYLHERVTQLAPLMDELDPYEPVRNLASSFKVIFKGI